MVKATISVIIPTFNEAGKIEQCLEAIYSQTLPPYEVILVDGHSSDTTIERAQKFPVKILYEDSHSIARGRQIGVEQAQGNLVAFTDADCVVDKNWIANLVKEFNDGIVAVGGGIKNHSQDFWEKSIHLALSTFIGGAQTVQGRFFNQKRLVKSVSACNAAWQLTYLEPPFLKQNFHLRGCPTNCHHYKGKIQNLAPGLCPAAESIQPKLMQFKTNYMDLGIAAQKAEALAKTIRYFG